MSANIDGSLMVAFMPTCMASAMIEEGNFRQSKMQVLPSLDHKFRIVRNHRGHYQVRLIVTNSSYSVGGWVVFMMRE